MNGLSTFSNTRPSTTRTPAGTAGGAIGTKLSEEDEDAAGTGDGEGDAAAAAPAEDAAALAAVAAVSSSMCDIRVVSMCGVGRSVSEARCECADPRRRQQLCECWLEECIISRAHRGCVCALPLPLSARIASAPAAAQRSSAAQSTAGHALRAHARVANEQEAERTVRLSLGPSPGAANTSEHTAASATAAVPTIETEALCSVPALHRRSARGS